MNQQTNLILEQNTYNEYCKLNDPEYNLKYPNILTNIEHVMLLEMFMEILIF